ncbi:MAG: heparinase II/III-family protein [Butyrivibrio sp.]|nr:heparinase II/III-family protein [Acetatifactor muris]MCM1559316.1 heparinase II/III-family protein [Butyrivibrio sp.]
MEMRFREAADTFLAADKILQDFIPFPAAADRNAYERLSPELKRRLIAEGEACPDYGYPPIYATDFMAFKRTGNRVNFERLYFERRYNLNSLVLAECVEHEGRFLDRIIDGVFLLCEESAWQLPPHNSYERNQPQEILPDAARPVLDLFACETGAQLACIYYLLKTELDAVSPFITARILSELHRRIFEPYLHQHFWWMGQGDEPMCNWTPWCTQNVLIAAFLADCSANIRRAVLQKAAASCDYFLKDYGEDGCCDEGALYFRRAGLCLDGAADLMNQVTDGAFSHLYQWEKMKNIAAYIENVHVEGKYYFNFADCSPAPGRSGVREFLFGKRTGQPGLMLFAAKDFQTAQEEIYQEEIYRLSLYYRLQNAFYYSEVMAYDASAPVVHRDIYYPSIGLFIARGGDFCLAVKAGDNGDNHNHNDTGSLTLYKKGRPVLVDIGVESYTGKTFSNQRYEIWTMQSGYHNLPAIEGTDQHEGSSYGASDVTYGLNEDRAEIAMELIHAYPLSETGHSYRRQVLLDRKTECVTLRDTTDCGNVVLNFITCEKPKTDDSVIILGDVELEFKGARLLAVDTLPITDPRLQAAWDHDLYRIRLTMTEREFVLNIK